MRRMKDYSFPEIEAAVTELETRLSWRAPAGLQEAFTLGLHPNLLAYDKRSSPAPNLTALERYLIGARSALCQPAHYYNIFHACRHVKIVQLLNHALKALSARKTPGLDTRVERLVAARTYDAFDAIVFELLVATRYLERSGVNGLEFVRETSHTKTPDIKMRQHGRETFCECKKMDRSQDHALKIRAAANACLTPVLTAFRFRRIAALTEVVFSDDPSAIGRATMISACLAAVESGTTIIDPAFTVRAKPLPDYESPTYKLYPSPDFFWSRYGYRVRGEWTGIVHQVIGTRTKYFLPPNAGKHGASSWLDEILWDSAVKWRLGSEALVAKSRRFGFNTLFDGLRQIEGFGRNSSVHLWLESNYYLGGREETLEGLRARIAKNGRDNFGWIVVNETLLDISPKGFFDLIEHAHFIRGPSATSRSPEVTNVFTAGITNTGTFGRGTVLPDIDDI
jgi:hypothetical protein